MLSIKKILTKLMQAVTTTTTTGTVGTASSVQGANNKRCYLVKTGTIVRCYVGIGYSDGNVALGSNVTLFTIPEGYRPKAIKIFPAVALRTNGKIISANLTFNTDGTITQSSTSDVTQITGSAEWETS